MQLAVGIISPPLGPCQALGTRKERVAAIQTVDVGQLQLQAEKLLCLRQHMEVHSELAVMDGRTSHCASVAWSAPSPPRGCGKGQSTPGEIDLPAGGSS